jgi:hypothetical protein
VPNPSHTLQTGKLWDTQTHTCSHAATQTLRQGNCHGPNVLTGALRQALQRWMQASFQKKIRTYTDELLFGNLEI